MNDKLSFSTIEIGKNQIISIGHWTDFIFLVDRDWEMQYVELIFRELRKGGRTRVVFEARKKLRESNFDH